MKIECGCGALIADSSDFLPDKAVIVADQDREDLASAMESGAEAWQLLREHTAATLYQCSQCSRLVLEREGRRHIFVAEEPAGGLLGSARGVNWRRPLVAHWRNGAGEIFCAGSGVAADDGVFETDIASWEELESRYRRLFESLLAAGRLRTAMLTRDGAVVHSWRSGMPDSGVL